MAFRVAPLPATGEPGFPAEIGWNHVDYPSSLRMRGFCFSHARVVSPLRVVNGHHTGMNRKAAKKAKFFGSLGIQGVCHCERSEVENARRVQSPLTFTEIASAQKTRLAMTLYKFPPDFN